MLVQIGSTSQTGERRHDWRVIGCWLVAAGVRIGRDRRQRLSDNRSDRNRASWFDECGGGQDVVDQLFAPLITNPRVKNITQQPEAPQQNRGIGENDATSLTLGLVIREQFLP